MQILHPFAGSIQGYHEEISDPNRYRPDHCPQCEVKHPPTRHGFYCRTRVDAAFDGVIRVRRYLCRSCKRTVSLLPEFAFPWLRSRSSWLPGCSTVSRSRLPPGRPHQLACLTSAASSGSAVFGKQEPALSLALAPLAATTIAAADFVSRALRMLESDGSPLTVSCFPNCAPHLLGWPACLVPAGRRITLAAASPTS